MKEKKERIEAFIKETIEQEAEDIRRENAEEADGGVMSAEIKERIWQKLEKDIDEYERRERYANLSEEDYRALRLGQNMLEKKKTEKKTARKKKKFMFYGGLAAVFALVIAVSINSVGRQERVAQFVTSRIGGREVIKVNSSDENLVIVDNEEEAYQVLREKFNIRPVQIVISFLEGMNFESMELDTNLQLAELLYKYKDEKIVYVISASYNESSWGTDMDDLKVNEYQLERKECVIEVKEYTIENTKKKKYSASFKYRGLEYFLTGMMEKDEFEIILKKAHFFS